MKPTWIIPLLVAALALAGWTRTAAHPADTDLTAVALRQLHDDGTAAARLRAAQRSPWVGAMPIILAAAYPAGYLLTLAILRRKAVGHEHRS
jgi:hypothetical protein